MVLRRHAIHIVVFLLSVASAGSARAERYVFEPVSDEEDGELRNYWVWDDKLPNLEEGDLYLSVGRGHGGTYYAASMAYRLNTLDEDQVVSDARLRLNMQGGEISSGFTVRISAALDLDPLDMPPGRARFIWLQRTQEHVDWFIPSVWDSSAQRIAKYAESPDLSPIINELLAQTGWDASPHEIVLFLEATQDVTLGNVIRFDDTHPPFELGGGNAGILPARLHVNETYHDALQGRELLCRPTPTSVQVNVIPHRETTFYAEYGTSPGVFDRTTSMVTRERGEKADILLDGLTPDTRVWYRLRYQAAEEVEFRTGPTHSFVTLPGPGQQARLCLTTDIHVTNMEALGLWTTMDLLDTTLDYIKGHVPDGYHAWIDLGDLVVVRAQRIVFDQEETEQRYREAREHVERLACCVPFVPVRGNHEEVNGWDDDGSGQNTMVWSGKSLKKWLPPPLPDSFYSGNDVPHPDIGLPGDYFAFSVGDLRIRGLDPYLFSLTRPHNGHGETGGSQDPWDWTLGSQQYHWLRDDLADNPTPFRIALLHHLASSYDKAGGYYGRGGVEVVDWAVDGRPSFEWGGQDATGQNVIAQKRPDFTFGSVHDLLSSFGNQAVLKGHDHFHARQELDGMIYLTVAKPDDDASHTGNLWGWEEETFYPDAITTKIENSGFISLVVDSDAATFDYVKSFPEGIRGTVADSFTIYPMGSGTPSPEPERKLERTWIRTVYPNPARVPPRIDFELGRDAERATLAIHDVTGRRVALLHEGALSRGLHTELWDLRDGTGRRVQAGVYFARLTTDGRVSAEKLVLLR
jgi:hypothetical protein